MSLSTGSPHLFGSDSAKRKRSDGSRLASEMHEQAGSCMSPQSARTPSPSKDQGRPPAYPSKKLRRSVSLDPGAEMSTASTEPPPWPHTFNHLPSNANPGGSAEPVSPARSPSAGNEMDLDVSFKEQDLNLSPHQHQHPPPPPPQSQQRGSSPPQQISQQQPEFLLRPQTTPTLPTGSGSHMWTEGDKNIIEQLRLQMSKEPGYDDFLESRSKQLTIREQLTHYAYIMKRLEEHTRGGSDAKKVFYWILLFSCIMLTLPRRRCM